MPSKIDSAVENWEDGTLGRDLEFAAVASDADDAKRLDDSVGIKPVSIRLDEKMISELKFFAEMEGLKYQPLIRIVLHRWLQAEKKMYIKYRAEQALKDQQEMEDMDNEELDKKRA
jgi:hypothetical protein